MHGFKVTTRKIGLEENTKELSGQLKPPGKVQPSVAVQFQTQVADRLLGGNGTSGYFSKRGKIRGGFLRLWVCWASVHGDPRSCRGAGDAGAPGVPGRAAGQAALREPEAAAPEGAGARAARRVSGRQMVLSSFWFFQLKWCQFCWETTKKLEAQCRGLGEGSIPISLQCHHFTSTRKREKPSYLQTEEQLSVCRTGLLFVARSLQ